MLREGFMLKVELALDYVTNDLQLRVAREGHLTAKHDIEHHSQGPYVNFRVVVLKKDLWCDIIRL
jgi:hypothetical protein